MKPALPEWPPRTIAVLVTTDDHDAPHAIPVSAPVRAGDHAILLSLARTRGSLARLRWRRGRRRGARRRRLARPELG